MREREREREKLKTKPIPHDKRKCQGRNKILQKKLYLGRNLQNRAGNHLRISSMPRGVSTILKQFLTHISLSVKSSHSRDYSTSLTNFSSAIILIVRKKNVSLA